MMKAPCFVLAAACAFVSGVWAPQVRAQAEEPSESAVDDAADSERGFSSLLGVQTFWLQDKVMTGLAYGARFGSVQLDVEASLLWLTEPAPPRGITHLGSELGAHVMFLPVRGRYFDLGVGVGGDLYWLWNVHGDAVETALAIKTEGNLWLSPGLGLYATARAYPLQSSGLELGRSREAEAGLPLAFSTGITWRL